MASSDNKSLLSLAVAAACFSALAVLIIGLAAFGVVTFQLGLLMLVGLVGLSFGLGVLVLIYRFVAKLE